MICEFSKTFMFVPITVESCTVSFGTEAHEFNKENASNEIVILNFIGGSYF